jgi:release factor glutamine methyltransferase
MTFDVPRRLGRCAFRRFYRRYALQRIARRAEVRLLGCRLMTDPEVLHPIHFLSTRVLMNAVMTLDLAEKRFLDMGSGSGAIGIVAASRGAVVTACDINPRAVAVSRENATRNGARLEVLQSDLFSALPGRQFDLICFNIPYYPGAPRTPFEAALLGGDNLSTVRAFAEGCRAALAPGGCVMVLFSEDADRGCVLAHFQDAGLDLVHEATALRWFERFHVVSFRSRPTDSEVPFSP